MQLHGYDFDILVIVASGNVTRQKGAAALSSTCVIAGGTGASHAPQALRKYLDLDDNGGKRQKIVLSLSPLPEVEGLLL